MEPDYTLVDPSLGDFTDTSGTGTTSVGNTAAPGTAVPSGGTSTGGFSIGNFVSQITPLVQAGAGIVTALKKPAATAPAGTAGAAAIPTTVTATNWQKWAIIGFGGLLVVGLLLKFLGRGKN